VRRAGRLVRRASVALVVGALLLEAALQLTALVAPYVVRAGSPSDTRGDAITILVVGDSHAAGAGVPADQNLAGHLERLLAARHPGRAFRFVNVGRAGLNSAYVANRLESNALTHRPRLIIVWVGVNDLWNALETESWGAIGEGLGLRRILLHSKLYRLATVLWHTHDLDDTAEARRWSRTEKHDDEIERGLAFDFERMARTAFALRTPILFVNYPVPYRLVNAAIDATGDRVGVPVLSTATDLLRARADGHSQQALLNFAAGPHPTGLLYRYVAESAVPQVEMALRQGGLDLARIPPP